MAASQPAIVATSPGTQAPAGFSFTGATGGDTSLNTTAVGGVGAAFSITGGTGGVAASAVTASTGGKGGTLTYTGGTGGAANAAANIGTNVGGAGGDLVFSGGTGGNAASGTDTGGAGGHVYIVGGAGGTGDSAGADGTVYIGMTSAGAARGAVVLGSAMAVKDDVRFTLGTDGDIVLVNRSTVLNTNTTLTSVLLGTPVTPAVAANSLIISNTTASGDILLAANNGGNSQAWVWVDSSAGTMTLYGAGVAQAIVTSTAVTVQDDILLALGTGSTARFSYDTTDANANALFLQLPAGGATDVPVLAIGQSIESVDLGLYTSVVDPRIAMFGVGAVTTAPVIEFRKARGTIASPTVVTTGDDLGTIDFYGCVANGEYVQAASIRADMAGTIGTTRGPGTLTFLTATDAAPSVLTAALTLGADQSATFGGVLVLPAAASINGTTSITINDNSGDVDFIVESNGNANMFTVDGGENAIGIGGAAVSGNTLTVTNGTLGATGRIAKLSATLAGAALTDGYGAFEVDVTLSDSPTDHAAAASAWVNITGGTVPAGTYICARNDGVYEATAATITNAKIVFGARMHKLLDDADALSFPFSINTNNTAITAVFDVPTATSLGVVANAGTSAATLVPFYRDANGTTKYVLLYDQA